MEALVESGMVAGVLDVTTTEWADQLVGGVLAAGPDRLDAMTRARVPAVIAPGCLDMVNFGERDTLPEEFEGRAIYQHNPQVTLVRTSADAIPQQSRAATGVRLQRLDKGDRLSEVVLVPPEAEKEDDQKYMLNVAIVNFLKASTRAEKMHIHL